MDLLGRREETDQRETREILVLQDREEPQAYQGLMGFAGLPGPPGERGLPDLVYMSDKPNYNLIRSVLDSLQQDLRLFLDPPDGTKEHPATTCLELWLCRPNFTNGLYYIDPNQGSPADSLLAYCDFTAGGRTCIYPNQAEVPMKSWLKDSGTENSFHWLTTHGGFQFEYPGATVVQLRFLKLNSRFASQNITYSCQSGHQLGQEEREVKFLADTRRQSYLGMLRDCEATGVIHSAKRQSIFQFDSEDLDLLPLRDLAVFGSSNFTQEFGFTVGPVCFS
ncbi:hypothetical protein JZ751_001194 [Albula glossodonta]|uniref:Fibrillar collagen NC1 domain-containing protein n=1 Tax=Albula glossodonta TaxID=121402 RepID=A0A8T2PT12_9TELE|nr:hypothetical protein JZ751_001194 [Albula glossodonta]